MTTYKVTSEGTGHDLVASWPDLPERVSHLVVSFETSKLAKAAGSVLNAASRYRWRRWLELLDEGLTSEELAGPDPTAMKGPTAAPVHDRARTSDQPRRLPRLPTSAILGDSPMSDQLKERIEQLLPDPGGEPESTDPDSLELAHRVPLGNLRPLLWRDWLSHLHTDEHDRLAAELEEDVAATTGLLVGRARQIAWYLSAELLIDEDDLQMMPDGEDDDGEESTRAFQATLVQLLSDLTGLRVESTAVDGDPYNEGLLRVHSPRTVVGFWFETECWYYGWPDPDSPNSQPTSWRHAGTLPGDTSIGDLASFITEGVAHGTWPLGGDPDGGRRSLFGGRLGRRS